MAALQSSIRAEVRRGDVPSPSGATAFLAYAIASAKGLIPEMEYAARLTLDEPMTFEVLGEVLREFDGCALRDLAEYRKRCRDNFVTCFKLFLESCLSSFSIWISCSGNDEHLHSPSSEERRPPVSSWLIELFRKHISELGDSFSKPLCNPRNIRGEYLSTLQAHIKSSRCVSCAEVHTLNGENFCKELEDILTEVRNKVCASFILPRTGVETHII